MPKIVDTIRNYVRWLRTAPDRQTQLYPRLNALFGHRTKSGRVIAKFTPDSFRTLSRTPTARRAINAIKNPIKHMDWEIRPRKGIPLNSEVKRQIRVATNCFMTPNNEDSFSTFVEKVVEDFLVVSAGVYEQQAADNPDHPVFMFPVDGQTIEQLIAWDGNPNSPRFRQTFGQTNMSDELPTLRDDEITYIVPNASTQTPYGYGPLEIAARSISRALGASEFAGNVASNSQPLNMIYLGDVGNPEIAAFRAYWRDEVEGLGQTPLVGGPDEPKAVGLRAANDDGLYLKWQEFLITEIARAFDLSPQVFGLQREQARVGNNAQSGGVTDSRDFKQAVVPMAMTLADYFTRHTILKKMGFTSIEFAWPALNAEDRKKQAEIDEIRYQNNMITPNQCREAMGEEPLDNPYADMLYADVQIAIGEARRGGVRENEPGILHNQPPSVMRQLTRRH